MSYIKSGWPALLLLPSILFVTGCRSAYNYFEKGDTAFARGKYAEASLNYRKAAQKDPTFGEAYYKAGLAELKQNQAAQALEDLQTAVRLMPDNQAAKTELTNLLLGAYVGDPKRPKFLYDLLVGLSSEWLKSDPNSLQGLRIKGYLAMLEQRPEEAVDLFRRAHQAAPLDEKIVDGLLDALFRANQAAEAEKVALDFLGADSHASDVYDALYRMYLGAHRTADAETILKRKVNANRKVHAYVLQLAAFYAGQHRKRDVDETVGIYLADRDNNPAARLEAGDFYASTGDLAAALEQYRSASKSANKDQSIYQNRIARVLLLQNKKQEGLAVLNQTLAHYPNNDEARALRAALLVGTPGAGKPGEGIQDLRALLAKNSDDLFLKFLLARALAERQDYAEARQRLTEIVKQRPEFLDAHILLADIAFKQRDMLETVRETDIALEADPENLRARMLRGSAMLAEGNLDQAGAVLGSLSRQVPDSVDVRLELAYISLNRRKYAEAEAAFHKILEAHPQEVRALAGLADTDLAQNRADQALERLDAALTKSHGSPAIRHLLAVTALRIGKYNVAIENLRQLISQAPNSIGTYLELANVFQLKGDIHSAIATLQKAAVLAPQDPRPGTLLPFLLETENRADEAKQVARQTLAARPDDTDAMNNLAFLLAQTGDSLDEAMKLAQAAVHKSPNNPAYLDTLGYVYLKRDRNDDALEIFTNLIRKYPNDPACAYHTAMAWYQKGDRARAKILLSHALELRPSKDIQVAAADLLHHVN